MLPKCPKGTRRNKKSGNCEPKVSKPELKKCPKTQSKKGCEPTSKPKRCPKGTRRNKKSGNCEPKSSQKKASTKSVPNSQKKASTNSEQLLKDCVSKSGECMIFGRATKQLKQFFEFSNFKYATHLSQIGSGSNGVVLEIMYARDNIKAYGVLKTANPNSYISDNLYYEYLVGKTFINYWNTRVPCFLETYGCYLSDEINKTFNLSKLAALKEFHLFSSTFSAVKLACKFERLIYLLIQHIHQAKTLVDFMFETVNMTKPYYILSSIYYQIYAPLAYLAREFTHYDLHDNNILIYSLPKNTYIEIIYVYSATNQISICTEHICKIIDYGRAYVNSHLFKELSNELCKEIDCKPDCGFKKGFFLKPVRGIMADHYISPNKNNISHDIYSMVKFINTFYPKYMEMFVFHDVKRSGTPSLETKQDNKIRNVMDVKQFIELVMQANPTANESFIQNRKKYGTLHVFLDGSEREMKYSP